MVRTITDQHELEYRLIFSLLVAGKNKDFAEKKVEALFKHAKRNKSGIPKCFDFLRSMLDLGEDQLDALLRRVRTGNYAKMVNAIKHLVYDIGFDLSACSPEDLEKVPGIGPKTSRFFLLWTREDAEVAALDVHILRWMREEGIAPDAPKTTPSSNMNLYRRLEKVFLQKAKELGKTPTQLDKEIWMRYSGKTWDVEPKKG